MACGELVFLHDASPKVWTKISEARARGAFS